MKLGLLVTSGSVIAMSMAAIAAAQVETRTHTYDPLGRLSSTEVDGGANQDDTRALCYDKSGNRTDFMTRENGSVPACTAPTPDLPPTSTPSPSPSPTPTPTNSPPNAVDDFTSGFCSTTVFIDVTANDSDPDGDTPLTVTAVSKQAGGASANLDFGLVAVTYGPDQDISTFEYTLEDPSGASDVAILTVWTTSCGGGGF